METKRKVLVIEDDEEYRKTLKILLDTGGYEFLGAENGKEAPGKLSEKPVAVILDLGLPDMDGFDVLKEIKRLTGIPVLVVSGRDGRNNFDTSFAYGADYYFTKTNFDGELLLSVLGDLIRKYENKEQCSLDNGRIHIDFINKVVLVNNKDIHLSNNEYRLLELFAKNPGKELENVIILKEIWGMNCDNCDYVKTLIKKLREKIEEDASKPRIIISEYSRGYRLKI